MQWQILDLWENALLFASTEFPLTTWFHELFQSCNSCMTEENLIQPVDEYFSIMT